MQMRIFFFFLNILVFRRGAATGRPGREEVEETDEKGDEEEEEEDGRKMASGREGLHVWPSVGQRSTRRRRVTTPRGLVCK